MKWIIGIMILSMILLVGCQGQSKTFVSDVWCSAQSGTVFLNGHMTNVTNTETGGMVKDCCCTTGEEFICICKSASEIDRKIFNSFEVGK